MLRQWLGFPFSAPPWSSADGWEAAFANCTELDYVLATKFESHAGPSMIWADSGGWVGGRPGKGTVGCEGIRIPSGGIYTFDHHNLTFKQKSKTISRHLHIFAIHGNYLSMNKRIVGHHERSPLFQWISRKTLI